VALSSSHTFTDTVARILMEYKDTQLELAHSGSCNREAARSLTTTAPVDLFPEGRHPEAAVSGLLLLVSCWEESHHISQHIASPEGSYWHAMAHRMEPDSANAGYWFRRVGNHPIFESLRQRGADILYSEHAVGWKLKPVWDPFLFLQWCDEARAAGGGPKGRVAREIQMVEWELLFQWCATGNGPAK
jgi:hypothetical protein